MKRDSLLEKEAAATPWDPQTSARLFGAAESALDQWTRLRTSDRFDLHRASMKARSAIERFCSSLIHKTIDQAELDRRLKPLQRGLQNRDSPFQLAYTTCLSNRRRILTGDITRHLELLRITWSATAQMHRLFQDLCNQIRILLDATHSVVCGPDMDGANFLFQGLYGGSHQPLFCNSTTTGMTCTSRSFPRNHILHFDDENRNFPSGGAVDVRATRDVDAPPNTRLWMPLAFRTFFIYHSMFEPRDLLRPGGWKFEELNPYDFNEKQKHFAAFAQDGCHMSKTYWRMMNLRSARMLGKPLVRTAMVQAIAAAYKPLDCWGKCLHNTTQPRLPLSPPHTHRIERVIFALSRYKFTVCAENSPGQGWLTEKLINAYLAHTVPIYWGPPDLEGLINMDAIIWCQPDNIQDSLQYVAQPDTTFHTCIAEIKRLDQDELLWKKKVSQPLFRNNKLPSWMRMSSYASQVLAVWNHVGVLKTRPLPS